jgi:cytochrome P450
MRDRGGSRFLDAGNSVALTGPSIEPEAAAPQSAVLPGQGSGVLLVTDYEHARRFLLDPTWSRAAATGHEPIGPASAMSITELDPPRHTEVRGMIGRAYSARAVERLRPHIRRRAADLINDMARAGPPADLVADFAAPFAFAVQCDVLGVPVHARQALNTASLARSARPGISAHEKYEAELALFDIVTDTLRHIRLHCGGGIFAELLAGPRQPRLSPTELTGLASSLFFDGHLLAAAQITNAVLSWLLHPAQLHVAIDDPGALTDATEELLRWCPSITLGMPRRAQAPCHFGDHRVPPGQIAALAVGLVNRDPAVFDEPHRLDVSRRGRHLSFGLGTHHCLGAHLVRIALHTALQILSRTLPGLTLAVDEQQLEWSASHTIRRLHRLPLTWESDRSQRRHGDHRSVVVGLGGLADATALSFYPGVGGERWGADPGAPGGPDPAHTAQQRGG